MMITFQLFWTDKDHSGAHALPQWALSIASRLPNSEMLGNPLSMTSQIGSNYFLPARSLQSWNLGYKAICRTGSD